MRIYEGTGQASPANQRRTHTLTNGQVIWDLAGNGYEWTNNIISCAAVNCTAAEMPYDATPSEEWVELTSLAGYGQLSYDLIRPSKATWNAPQGMGKINTDANEAYPSGNVHAFLCGGSWANISNAGVFTLNLINAPSLSSIYVGFRCITSPMP